MTATTIPVDTASVINQWPGIAAELDFFLDETWEDQSYSNDVCARWRKKKPGTEGQYFVLWVDYVDPAKREYPEEGRFALTLYRDVNGEEYIETLLTTDDFNEIMEAVNS